ncbi:MAG: hypothetical protein ABIJ65_01295 [Chloroflexota bacterium]
MAAITSTITGFPTPDPVIVPLPNMQSINSPSLIDLSMFDLENGWGVTETSLVRTLDGGLTWYDITPPGVSSLGYSASIFFLDPDTGWVVIAGPDFLNGTLMVTTDGGLNWSSVAVPFAGGQIDFIDHRTGFILVGRGAAAGSSAVDVYSSTDGGVSWEPVYIMQPGIGDDVNTLPFSGQKSGFSFLDSLHGWVGGSIPMDGNVYFYTSLDGGYTWVKQHINLPGGYETAMTEVETAQFFSVVDGLLPVRLFVENSGYVFFVTHDSGITWISTTPLISNGQYSLASINDIFVWDGGADIYVTHDSGLTWNQITTNINVTEKLMKIEFVDSETGWMLTGDATTHHTLYKTLDGGSTWNILIP